jgi:predicted kinase
MPTLYLMLGYPGAGKTTTAEIIHQLTGAVHMSSDKLRLELFSPPSFSQTEHDALYKALDQRTEALLQEGKSVIYDANLNRYQHRKDKYDICIHTSANPVLVWVQTPKDIAKHRATETNRLHLVPRDETLSQMFDRIAGLIEKPVADESYIAIDGTNVTAEYIARQLKQ